MNKKSLTKNTKKPKSKVTVNIFDKGSWKTNFQGSNLAGTLGGIASGLGSVVSAGLANAEVDTSEADNAIEAVESFRPATASLDALADSYNNLNMADTSYNHRDFMVSTGEGLANMGKAALSGLSAGASLGPWGAVAGAAAGLATAGAGWLAGAAKAKSKADELAVLSQKANLSARNKTLAARDDIQQDTYDDFMRNRIAYGGPLFNHSGDWSNGLTFINEGGTHEENPYEGIQVGVDNQGVPNLVEEGEIIFNDYVFSNRLKPTKKQLSDSGLNKKYKGLTFARIVEDLQKASAETPNDKISMDTLNDLMGIVINMQEEVRMKKKSLTKNKFDIGGWTDEDSAAREEEIMAGLWDAANAEMQAKVDSANRTINGDPGVVLLNKAFPQKTPKATDISTPVDTGFDFANTMGMLAPTINSLASTIYNAAKPVDKSNLIAGKSQRQRPLANYSRINVTPTLDLVDENALVAPIVNRGSAAAREAINLGQTAGQTLANLANLTYNTQTAEGEARLKANQTNYTRKQAYNQALANIQKMNSAIEQAEFTSNAPIYQAVTEGDIKDALMYEQLQQMKGEALNHSLNTTIQGAADLARQNIEWGWIKDNPQWAPYFNRKSKCGGMLTRRRK